VAWLAKGATPANIAQARGFFDRALTVDPDNVDALILSAIIEVSESVLLCVKNPVEAYRQLRRN
jgi:hypothetical protein